MDDGGAPVGTMAPNRHRNKKTAGCSLAVFRFLHSGPRSLESPSAGNCCLVQSGEGSAEVGVLSTDGSARLRRPDMPAEITVVE